MSEYTTDDVRDAVEDSFAFDRWLTQERNKAGAQALRAAATSARIATDKNGHVPRWLDLYADEWEKGMAEEPRERAAAIRADDAGREETL